MSNATDQLRAIAHSDHEQDYSFLVELADRLDQFEEEVYGAATYRQPVINAPRPQRRQDTMRSQAAFGLTAWMNGD